MLRTTKRQWVLRTTTQPAAQAAKANVSMGRLRLGRRPHASVPGLAVDCEGWAADALISTASTDVALVDGPVLSALCCPCTGGPPGARSYHSRNLINLTKQLP